MNYTEKIKKSPYFEGWYFKQESSNNSLCVIVGRSCDIAGEGKSFIQIIADGKSVNINYPLDNFVYLKNRFAIKLGKNYFTEKGIVLDIDDDVIKIKGKIEFGELTELSTSIMGPFEKLPFIECKHTVISMYHSLYGKMTINGQEICFDNGTGYIEGDRGKSFPGKYKWFQCNDFEGKIASVTVAVADIPLIWRKFCGCFAVIYARNRIYRLATYKGAKIQKDTDNRIVITQGKYRLCIDYFSEDSGCELSAPVQGNMSRTIKEGNSCYIRVKFSYDDFLVFSGESDRCSYENPEET